MMKTGDRTDEKPIELQNGGGSSTPSLWDTSRNHSKNGEMDHSPASAESNISEHWSLPNSSSSIDCSSPFGHNRR